MSLNEIESNTDKSCYNKIKLYYFSGRRNLGDELNKDILRYIGADYCCTSFCEANLIAMGSLLSSSLGTITDINPAFCPYYDCIDIWGTGFIQEKNCENEFFTKNIKIHALRGKLSKARCEDILGHKLDGIALGDPALLTSRAITVDDVEKKYDVGVIPHYVDRDSDLLNKIKLHNKSYRIIGVQGDTRQICREICECRLILSSALHGLIVADSYGIPNRWIRFYDNIIGGNYKFNDYYSVFNIEGLEPIDLRKEIITDQDIDLFITHYPIKKEAVERICDDLEKAFPRKRVFDLPMSASYLNEIESKRNKSIEENKQAIDCFDLSVRNLYDGDFRKAEENISKYKYIINYDSFPKYDRRFLENPELSVIIVAYNTRDKLVDCVESLLNNNAGNYEIIIVDNGGNEKVVDKLLGFRLLYISSPHNFGPSEGRNIGAYFAKGEIVAFLDDDAISGKDYVKTIIESFRKYKIIGLRGKVLPKTNHYNNKEAGHYDLGNNCKFIRYVNAECNSAFSKNEYFKLNGMNPLLFGHEGIELSYRIEKSHEFKKILYSSEIIIYHDYACSDLKFDIKAKRNQVMMSYLKYMHPDIEDFIADIDYFNSDIPSNMNISFSIIMPTYNSKHCIKNAINSLLTQTYQNYELIVIDDGSTDGTDKYLKDIYKGEIRKEKINFIKLPENKGAAFARNEGLRKAKHNWIGYLDADNQMHSNFLATFAYGIERNQTYEIFYAQIRHMQSQAVIGHEFDFDELVQFNFIDLGVFVHSRRIYNELGGFDVKLYRLIDWDLIIKYTEKYPPKFIEKVLLDYDDNPKSSRITNTVPCDDAYKKLILNYFKRIPANNFIEKYTGRIQHFKRAVAERDGQIANLEAAIKEKDASIEHLDAAIREKDANIGNLEGLLREREATLNHIYNSHGWKALLIYYSFRNKLLPPNSKRRMLAKLFLYSVTNTKSVLKGLNKNNLRKFLRQYGTAEPSVLESKIKRNLTEKNIQPSNVKDASSYYTTSVEDELFANVEILKPYVEKNRILVVDRFLPTYDRDAGSLRAFSIIKILTKLGYRVTFLPDDLTKREPYASDLIRMGVAVLNGPLDVEKYFEKKGPEFSYVILSRPEQTYKYISLMRAHAINSKIIYDTVDLHWVRLERGYKTTGHDELLVQANFYKTMELLCASCSDMVLTVTSEEKEIMLRENPRLKVEIIPTIHNITSRDIQPFHQRKDLMFIGGYAHKPNEDAVVYFINEIFPLVKQALPEARFFAIGSDPSDALLKRNSKDIIVSGYVADVKPYFEDCRVFVAPLRYGAGMKGKIGQSMAYGLPVVTTGIGAEGIGLEDGISALIADDPKSFAEAIIRLYTNENLWRRCSEKAFEVIESNYTDEAIGKRINNILNSLKGEGI